MLFVVAFAFSGPAVPGRREFGVFAVFTGLWCALASAEYLSVDFALRQRFASAIYIGAAGVPVAWLLFACRYTGLDRWVSRLSVGALSLIPLATVCLAASNGLHGWIWASVAMVREPLPDLVIEHGWWFRRVHMPYSYLLMLAGLAVLVSRFFGDLAAYRSQVLGIVLATALGLLTNLAYVFGGMSLLGIDPTPLALALLTLVFAVSFFHGFLGSAPLSYRQVFIAAGEGIVMVDGRDRIVDINPAGAALAASAAPVGRPLDAEFSWLSGRPGPPGSAWCGEALYGIREAQLRGSGGSAVGRALLLRNITAEHSERLALRQQARIDSLTGTLNRGGFVAAVGERLDRRPAAWPLALLYIDLDRFKAINDRHGHGAGDAVLRETARRIEQRLRPGDLVGRLGGDEFSVLLDRADREVAAALGARIGAWVDAPFDVDGGPCTLGASIGYAVWPEDGEDTEALLRRADREMYAAKRAK